MSYNLECPECGAGLRLHGAQAAPTGRNSPNLEIVSPGKSCLSVPSADGIRSRPCWRDSVVLSKSFGKCGIRHQSAGSQYTNHEREFAVRAR